MVKVIIHTKSHILSLFLNSFNKFNKNMSTHVQYSMPTSTRCVQKSTSTRCIQNIQTHFLNVKANV